MAADRSKGATQQPTTGLLRSLGDSNSFPSDSEDVGETQKGEQEGQKLRGKEKKRCRRQTGLRQRERRQRW